MPTTLDTQLRPVARDLLDDYGRTVTVRMQTSSYDPATDTVTTTNEDISTKGFPQGYDARFLTAKQTGAAASAIPTLIEEGDLVVMVPGTAFDTATREPGPGDLIYFGAAPGSTSAGDPMKVISNQKIFTGEQVALHMLQVRGDA